MAGQGVVHAANAIASVGVDKALDDINRWSAELVAHQLGPWAGPPERDAAAAVLARDFLSADRAEQRRRLLALLQAYGLDDAEFKAPRGGEAAF